ncbi:MAG: 23S rRNA (guanosine(2251)-2'-O)-methyltransferase RlmB [Thermodesulfobacteriota bacterium]
MIIYGKNAVFELLKNNPKDIREILLSEKSDISRNDEIRDISRNHKIKLTFVDKNSLNRICSNQNHQGIAAKVDDFLYSSTNEILEVSQEKHENLFLLILDHIEDPHNLGAIIRTADFLGVHGIVIPKDRACEVNPTVIKVSSGAAKNIKIAMETNLSQLIDNLKKKDIWIIGADGESSQFIYSQDLKNLNIAVVIGNEGKGLQKKIKEKCDFLLSIPKIGKIDSLNASVAAGIFLYEILRQRNS